MSNPKDKIIEAEEKKRLIMKVGVISFSVIIFILWVFSVGFSFNSKKNNIEEGDITLRQNLQEIINTTHQNFNVSSDSNTEEKNFLDNLLKSINDKNQEKIAEVNLENIEDTEKIVLTATSTESQKFLQELENKLPLEDDVRNDCPAYINCMPTIGQSQPCVIPSGCEAITQIVY